MENINSGKVLDMLKSTFRTIGKAFDRMMQFGMQVNDANTDKKTNISTVIVKTKDGFEFKIMYQPLSNKGDAFRVKLVGQDGKSMEDENVADNDFDDTVCDMMKRGWGIDWRADNAEDTKSSENSEAEKSEESNDASAQTVAESRYMNVELQKIYTSDNTADIKLLRVYGNYDVPSMSEDLHTMLNSPDAVNMIPEEATGFQIRPGDDAISFDPAEMDSLECTRSSLLELLTAAYTTLMTLQKIHWNAAGSKFYDIHNSAGILIDMVLAEIDTLAEWCVEYTKSVPHPSYFVVDPNEDTTDGYRYPEAIEIIKDSVKTYNEVLEFYVDNFEPDVQDVIRSWVREHKKNVDYFADRMLSE